MKTQFVKFIGDCAINGNMVEVRENRKTGALIIRHERNGRHSGLCMNLANKAALDEYIDSKQLTGAQLLWSVLHDIGAVKQADEV